LNKVAELKAHDGMIFIAFVEAESALGAALAERLTNDITPISAGGLARWRTWLGNVSERDQVFESPSSMERYVNGRPYLGFLFRPSFVQSF